MNLSSRLDTIRQSLYDLGYQNPSGAIIPDYNYVAHKDGKKVRIVDFVAFGDAQIFDISTSCIAVNEVNGNIQHEQKVSMITDLAPMGAPIVLFAFPEFVEIWPVSTYIENIIYKEKRVSYQELPKYLNTQGHELSPRSLLSAKHGERQLSFYDIDSSLVEFARETTQDILVNQFEMAISLVPPEIREAFPKELSRLAVWVLAARILQDKLVDDNLRKIKDVITLLNTVQNQFPNYFTTLQQDLDLVSPQAAYEIYDALSGDFTFRSLTNDMLAYFYENTLVDELTRKALGIYYTPRNIAQHILHRLPIEDLKPEERIVLDGTCGSGNLLLASYDRLIKLLPFKLSSHQKQEYLLDHIWGIDKDSFACEIARLSLLLYNLPLGDSWKIINADVFRVKLDEIFGQQPHIIVGNPPFKESTDPEDNNRRIQKAAQIVDLYLKWLAPNGLMGVVLPLTFLHNPSAKNTREKLLTQCDILEIWHLPEGAIPGSSAATAVILARKLPTPVSLPSASRYLTRVNEVIRVKQPFIKNGGPTLSYVKPQSYWLSNPQWLLTSSRFDHIWGRINEQFLPVDPVYGVILNGIKIGKLARPTHLRENAEGMGWRPVLNNNLGGKILEPFLISWHRQSKKYVKYPSEEVERGRNKEDFEVPRKVVMNATRNPSSPWRFYAAIDSSKLVVTENFHYVLPKGATCEELVAILNSMLANAWFAGNVYHRDVTLEVLQKLPFPEFSPQQKKAIKNIVSEIEFMKQTPGMIDRRIQMHIDNLDDIIFDAYMISSDERQQIRGLMGLFPRPGYEWEKTSPNLEPTETYQGKSWILTGQVEDINPESNQITLWIDGKDDLVTLDIPATMPGWALRSGVTFQAATPWEQRYSSDFSKVSWLDFQPLDYGYFTIDELETYLTSLES